MISSQLNVCSLASLGKGKCSKYASILSVWLWTLRENKDWQNENSCLFISAWSVISSSLIITECIWVLFVC